MLCARDLHGVRMRQRPARPTDGAPSANFRENQVPALLRLNAALSFALILAISRPGLAGKPFFGPGVGLAFADEELATVGVLARVPATAAPGTMRPATRHAATSRVIFSVIV